MSFISADSVDDLLRKVFTALLKSKSRVSPTKGDNGEIFGILLELKDPRARLSRAESRSVIYSCLGEFLWYMSGSNSLDFVQYYITRYDEYSEEDGTVHGAYGPRLFGKDGLNQVENVIRKLETNPASRKAVIQLFDARDLEKDYKDVPCTCTLQFVIRNKFLHMETHMRSNDAFMGLPHDIFCFTMIQEILANRLGVRLGTYKHSVGSLHLYDKDAERAQRFLNEGFQDPVPMPAMPKGDQLHQIGILLEIEGKIRNGAVIDASFPELSDYWGDIARLLAIKKEVDPKNISRVKRQMKSKTYTTFIRKTQDRVAPEAVTPDFFK